MKLQITTKALKRQLASLENRRDKIGETIKMFADKYAALSTKMQGIVRELERRADHAN